MAFLNELQIQLYIEENEFPFLIETIKEWRKNLCMMTTDDLENIIKNSSIIISTVDFCESINSCHDDRTILLTETFKLLRNICAGGSEFQKKISEIANIYDYAKKVLCFQSDLINENFNNLKKFCLQCIANICVSNPQTQSKTFLVLHENLISEVENIRLFCDISAMILYNTFFTHNNFRFEVKQRIYKCLIKIVSDMSLTEKYDFVTIFVEYFLINYSIFCEIYNTLNSKERLGTIYFALEIVKQDDKERRLNTELMKQFVSDFKRKSDCILKTVPSDFDSQEVYVLLELIASATGQTRYSWIFALDSSLFLNVGCLLRSIHELGRKSVNMFTPLQKLEDLAPNSEASPSMETEVSYQFKSLLVRTISNLSYKNTKLQNLAREMDIIQSVLECTNADARNPLIKEWSILAIRNLCADNLENQNIIAGLTKLENAENPILTDLIAQTGSLRICPQ